MFTGLGVRAAEAWKKPLEAQCETEAEVLSISEGKFYWNQDEFYRYFDMGILVTNIKSLNNKDNLLACSPLKEKNRTDIVRVWDWNNKGTIWVYKNDEAMTLHDKVKLKLAQSYVGDGSLPTVIGAELIDSNENKQSITKL